jgi:hypothetical protein
MSNRPLAGVALALLPGLLLAAVACDAPADPSVNAPLCTASGPQDQLAGARDAAGRPVFAWRDGRAVPDNVVAQRLGFAQQPLWAEASLEPGADACRAPRVVVAGDGVIVVWQVAAADSGDIAALRLDPLSGAPVWPAPTAVVAGAGSQRDPLAVPDPSGGAIVAWTDTRSGTPQVFAQRVDAGGAVRWTAGGVGLRTGAGTATLAVLVADGAAGAVAAWADSRGGYWAQRVDSLGVAAWAPDGVPLCGPGAVQGLVAVADDTGGMVAAYEQTDGTGFFRDLYAQRLRGTGVRAWPDTGVVLSRARYFQRAPAITGDGAGGAIVAWDDSRTFHLAQVFAQRVDSAGAVPWTADGVALCTTNDTRPWPAIAPDGSGGAVVAWQDGRAGQVDVWAQRVSASGAPLWTPEGVPVSTAADSQRAIVAVPDGAGGATFAWVDGRGGVPGSPDLYSQHVRPDGTLDPPGAASVPPGRGAAGVRFASPSPNPASGMARFAWTLARATRVELSVLDPQGRVVRALVGEECAAGEHGARWDLRDDAGERVAAGLWFVALRAGGATIVQRLVTIR